MIAPKHPISRCLERHSSSSSANAFALFNSLFVWLNRIDRHFLLVRRAPPPLPLTFSAPLWLVLIGQWRWRGKLRIVAHSKASITVKLVYPCWRHSSNFGLLFIYLYGLTLHLKKESSYDLFSCMVEFSIERFVYYCSTWVSQLEEEGWTHLSRVAHSSSHGSLGSPLFGSIIPRRKNLKIHFSWANLTDGLVVCIFMDFNLDQEPCGSLFCFLALEQSNPLLAGRDWFIFEWGAPLKKLVCCCGGATFLFSLLLHHFLQLFPNH